MTNPRSRPADYSEQYAGMDGTPYPSRAVEAEQCRTCGETQPHTGTCGTSDGDTQALCKRAPSHAGGTDSASALREIRHAAWKRGEAETVRALDALLGGHPGELIRAGGAERRGM
jgi:hypothetical protein